MKCGVLDPHAVLASSQKFWPLLCAQAQCDSKCTSSWQEVQHFLLVQPDEQQCHSNSQQVCQLQKPGRPPRWHLTAAVITDGNVYQKNTYKQNHHVSRRSTLIPNPESKLAWTRDQSQHRLLNLKYLPCKHKYKYKSQ